MVKTLSRSRACLAAARRSPAFPVTGPERADGGQEPPRRKSRILAHRPAVWASAPWRVGS
ncbi:hypothetical protein GCM10009677_40850 [Sphaerisporangium rubeum]